MKRKTKILISCSAVLLLLFSMALSCFGAVSDIEDSIIVDSIFYCANDSYSSLKKLSSETIEVGDTLETSTSFMSADRLPNFFLQEMNFYSSSGLPLMESGKTYKFVFSNLYDYIDDPIHGVKYLQKVDQIRVNMWYTDGTYGGFKDYDANGFLYSSSNYRSHFEVELTSNKPVDHMYIRLYYDIADFGLPFYTSSSDLSDVIYHLGVDSFHVSREEVFPTANSGAFDDYGSAEGELMESTSGGLQDVTSAFGNLTNVLSPNGSMYKGVLFMGSLMKEFVNKIPDLNDIILVSLAIGVITIILGFGADITIKSLKNSGNRQKQNTGKNKGGK